MSHSENPTEETKDAKRNKIEELKAQQDGLDIWRDIEKWAVTGYDSIPPEKFDLFKWYGLYRQRPNDGHFMIRIRIPGGKLTAPQAREVAAISREYGRGTLDLTVRQNFQIHWLTIDILPEAVRRLQAVGLTTTETCGDTPRNIIGCPLAGKEKHEIVDADPVVQAVTRTVVGNRAYSNLPRKFKMSISGCSIHCPLPEINDIGLYGAILNNGKGEGRGFNLMAGGGLSTRPYFGKVMNAFVPFHQAEAVCLAILELFRDRGYRESRKRARMKFLVDDLGADAFRAEIVKRLGSDLDPPAEAKFNPRTFRDHIGVLEQKQPGLFSLGFVTLSGRILPEDLEIAAEIAERFGSGELANSCMQNLLVCDVPEDRLAEAQNLASKAPTLTLDTNPLRAGLVVCTGLQFCNLAVTETKNRSAEILAHLEQEAVLDTPIKIAVSGCPNSCSQFQAADIGLRGGLTRVGGEPVEAYDISVGCEMGPEGEMGRLLKKAIPAPQVKEELAAMLKNYLKERQEGETYQQYARRVLLPA